MMVANLPIQDFACPPYRVRTTGKSGSGKALAEAIVEGLVLRIEGGEFQLADSQTGPGGGMDPRKFLAALQPGDPSKMKKIAVSSEGPDLDSEVDPRFGRAAGFVVVDPDTMEFEYVDNGASQAMAQGAGIQAAELMTRHGVGVVLSGYVGPKAFQALAAVGIRVGQNLENMTVRQALDKFRQGEVPVAQAPNRAGGRA